MRLQSSFLIALFPAACLLSGCAMGPQGATTTVAPQASATKTVSGRTMGGQQSVAAALIAVYQYGTSGYGSAGTPLAVAATDEHGNFTTSYTCTDPNAAVYILSIGGQPGPNIVNTAIAEGAAIGTCAASETAPYINISEISTVALAYSLSHFFSSTNPDFITADHFGAPASLSNAVNLVNSHLIPTILDVVNGYPAQSSATFTNESAKMITLADIMGSCVNSDGAGSPSCSQLFSFATPAGGTAPVDTLQAMVNIALNPTLNVANLFSLVPPSGSGAFAGSLPTQPNDWTLAVSYTNPSFGLGVNSQTVTTLDIDTAGRVWFPTNVAGATGVAFFDPSSSAFSTVFTAPGLVRPEQVAIDATGYVWATDIASDNIAGFPISAPSAPVTLSMPGTTSTSLTVDYDNTLRVAVVNTASATPAFAEVSNQNTYSALANTTPQGSQNYIGASLAGAPLDGSLGGGTGISGTDLQQPNAYDVYLYPNNNELGVFFQAFADSGQIVFNGDDFITARGGYNAAGDGICSFVERNCYAMADQTAVRHPAGLAVDGNGNLWLADTFSSDIQEIPRVNGSLLNSNTQAPNQVYAHGTSNGGTMTVPGGIGIDATGNVWVSNIGCNTNGCTPGAFVLTEVLGAGVPTVNPVSAQLNGSAGTAPSAVHASAR